VHADLLRYPGSRALMVRKTRVALTEAALMTFEDKVLPPNSRLAMGASRPARQGYRYPNGSVMVIGGLDHAQKVMSTEYDAIYVQEATELEENDWEYLTTRLRNGRMPHQQLIADCNPDRPTHWLKARCDAGRTRLVESRHEDNPLLWSDAQGDWTRDGALYIARLDALTGARRERLRFGRWAAAEGLVYEGWDRQRHVLPAQALPPTWPRYWCVDFGYTNPFVWQQWALDPDGRLYLEREIYRTQALVEDHCRSIMELTKGAKPRAVVCDHDAEGRGTLERHLGVTTTPAFKEVAEGIQAVAQRLRTQGDGQPRLFVLADALALRDGALMEAKRPVCTEQEFDSYAWPKGADGKPLKEEPVKSDDHGLDCCRYLVCHVDEVGVKKARFFF
jgi:phage terminase large subunit